MAVTEHVVETDILIVGGSVAGGFAAIKAKQDNPSLDVLIVDKGYASKSGGGGIAGGWFIVWNPEWGRSFEDTKKFALDIGEYINNQEWLDIQIRESWERFQDLASWGAPYHKDENGDVAVWPYGPVLTNVRFDSRKYLPPMRAKAESLGVKFMDRLYVTELLKQGDEVVGALGFSTETGDCYVLKAKAVILAAGCAGFKTPGFMGDFRDGSAEAAAYRAGAKIVSREFGGKEGTAARHWPNTFVTTGTIVAKHYINAEGRNFMPDYLPEDSRYGGWQSEVQTRNSWLFEVAAGRGPIYWNIDGATPEEKERLKVHKTLLPRAYIADQLGINILSGKVDIIGGTAAGEAGRGKGGVMINTKCETNLPGLYAAGDNAGSMSSGSSYVSAGWAFPHAAVTGHRAGQYAAEYAASKKEISEVDWNEVARLKEVMYAPLNREGGYGVEWVLERLQNLVAPYYALQVKHGERLEGTIKLMNYMRDHLVPMLTASDPHELRMTNELRNMVVNAEMALKASLFRTESRGGHYREDYPFRDDPEWLAWVVLKQEQGEMTVEKKPIPKEWWPDLSVPYTERYQYRIPAEVIK